MPSGPNAAPPTRPWWPRSGRTSCRDALSRSDRPKRDFAVTPEPSGADVDLHLLSALRPQTTITRHDKVIHAELQPGRYWLVVDTYGNANAGAYSLDVMLTPIAIDPAHTFNAYILKAVEVLYRDYRQRGYGAAGWRGDEPSSSHRGWCGCSRRRNS